MSKQPKPEGYEEVIVLFNADGTVISSDMLYAEFDAMVSQASTLEAHAASVVKAVYCVVATGLAVRGLVFFQFKVDEDGLVDPSFNVPLRYLVRNAGAGPDLGMGAVRLACRGRCPVPWQSINLWEPAGKGDAHPAMLAQKAVWRNRLGLKPLVFKKMDDDALCSSVNEEQQVLEERLTETFGEEGKVSLQQLIAQHNQQLSDAGRKYRSDMQQQQTGYLDQIRDCKDEIQKLKVSLRHEQERSRRLQGLLRGDP